MQETTRNGWRKFGHFCLAFVPLILYFVITLGVSMVLSILVAVRGILEGQEDLFTYIMEGTVNNSMLAGVIYASLGIICLGLWYYFGCKRKNLKPPKSVVNPVNLLCIAVFAFAMQYVTNYLMAVIDLLMPRAMDAYEELIELAGVGEVTLTGILYGVILGPIAEELCFRGVTLFYAQKATRRFWLANILQAAAFGIMHLNLVQGLYAFVLGLAMGWVYHRFHSIYATIWLHIFFNFLAYGPLVAFDGLLPENAVFRIAWAAFTGALAIGMLLVLTKRTAARKVDSGAEA